MKMRVPLLASLIAGFIAAEANAQEGKLVIGASEVKRLNIEYSDGRKEFGCRVVFTLTNKSGRKLHRGRFWVEAANGKRESFGLSDRKTKNRERFENTKCDAVRGKLKLRRAACQWAGEAKPVDCTVRTVIDVK